MKLLSALPFPGTNLKSSLEDLVRRSRAGDAGAFNEIVEQFYGVTYGMAYRMLGNREAAEDATQEVFLKAWRHLSGFRGASRFSTWLHSIAVNECLGHARKRKREHETFQPVALDEWLEGASGPNQVEDRQSFNAENWALNLALQDAVRRLPEHQRVPLALRYYGHLSVEEIAEVLGLNSRTVRSRLHLALKQLRCKVGYLEEPER